MEGDNQNYWYIIPAELAESGKPLKALLFGLISSLCNKSGKCFASNKFLATKLGFNSERTASQYINELVKEKYLLSQIDKQSGNSRILQIGIASERARYSVETLDPYSVKTLHSNKYISNKKEYTEVYQYFIDCFEKNPNTYKMTEKRVQKLAARIKDAGIEMLKKAIYNTSKLPFYRGENDRKWEADLDWIIKSYEQVEKMAARIPVEETKPKNYMLGEGGYVEI